MGHPRAGLDYAAAGVLSTTRISALLIRNPRSTNFFTQVPTKTALGGRLSTLRSDPKIACLTGPQKSRLPITLRVP
jgi:hypothetical protein